MHVLDKRAKYTRRRDAASCSDVVAVHICSLHFTGVSMLNDASGP